MDNKVVSQRLDSLEKNLEQLTHDMRQLKNLLSILFKPLTVNEKDDTANGIVEIVIKFKREHMTIPGYHWNGIDWVK